MFKIYMTQTLLIPMMMKMITYLKALAVKVISSSLVKQQIVYVTGLDDGTKLKSIGIRKS